MHMADEQTTVTVDAVVLNAEAPPVCLLGPGNCTITVAPLPAPPSMAIPVEAGPEAPSIGTAPQLIEDASHGPPRAARLPAPFEAALF